ncbi:amidohydrolase family protein [Actinomadura barringtoniae]|uniref:Amidohydrolase family protein n=1 Tax=Actinomadura barringtoniae TaxID=1427535 RepID=A0A939PL92_9ACTN|nr:amidohydrolase family protein [Actinomadura barringtoniae]MBO2450631.1 amidohydrolase family protein [Actinomadura barringtoniae]
MLERLESLRLVDHHCHGVVGRELDRADFESMLTEAPDTTPLGGSLFDSQVGFALRRWCPSVLDLPAHAEPDDYLARRAELGAAEVNQRFLAAAGLDALCVDTGYTPEPILEPEELGKLAGARAAYEIVRLERLAEQVAAEEVTAAAFADEVRRRLDARTAGNGGAASERAAGRAGAGGGVVGCKSIAAYRAGLEMAGERPTEVEVKAAAGRLLREAERAMAGSGASPRVNDEVLHRFLVWCAVERGLPVQFHVGYGDSDTDLRRGDPLLLTALLRAVAPTGVPIMLLHNYPFHRNAGYLAQVFPNVFVDAGLATHNIGHRSPTLIAELLELAPFGKVLFSSDAYGLAELYYLGALLFRRGLGAFLGSGIEEGAWTAADAERVADLVAAGNGRRAYRLDQGQ